MTPTPLSLNARDFDAYAPEKATSNAYSRPRLEVKQRALAWARGVVARLGELGMPVDVHGSDEHPTLRNKKRVDRQWVFFSRDAEAREGLDRLLDRGRSIADEVDDPSPYRRHAFLGLRLDARSVEVCFSVHPEAAVDLDNLRALLADEAAGGELLAALRALPEELTMGLEDSGDAERVRCTEATLAVARELVERAAERQVPLSIGWSIPKGTAIEHAALLDEQLEDALVALAPIYRLVAWSRQNDHVALERRFQRAEEERAQAHAEAEAQTERWRAEQAEARKLASSLAPPKPRADEASPAPRRGRGSNPPPASVKPRPSLDALFAPPGAPPSTSPAPAGDRAPDASRPRPVPFPAGTTPVATTPAAEAPSPTARAGSSPRITPSSPLAGGGLEKGAKVRVRTGAFIDKVGVIGELDGRGGARVLLGLLSTRLDLGELELVPEGREPRPALQSSHRKPASPLAARPGARVPPTGKARG